LESFLDDNRAVLLQRHFHETFKIPLNRIHIQLDNISDLSEKASAKLHYGDSILGIPASPFGEFIDAFIVKQVEEISAEWRLASHRLKDEPHHLWNLLKHILASKFTYLFRGIPPGFVQPLADCLTHLHRETSCEILAQSETIPNISFDNLARIREGAGLGYADDLLDSAFAASKITSLRSIEQGNPGYLASVKAVFKAGTAACHDSAFPLPARQLASSLLAVHPTFLQNDHQGQNYSGLRKLQSAFLALQKVARTVVVVEGLLCSNNVQNTIYQSGKSPDEARAWLDAVPNKTEALTMSSSEFWTAFRDRLLIPHPQLLAHATCACGEDVEDVLGVHT
jgi:hypothetical protein